MESRVQYPPVLRPFLAVVVRKPWGYQFPKTFVCELLEVARLVG